MKHNVEREKNVQVGGARGNKVSTNRMKERRIRLSANTAIQFYDVQDRLGYDRATKAIDWLMKKAKVAIDALDADHQDHRQEYLIPSTTVIFSPSDTFHRSSYYQNQQNSNLYQTNSFNNHPFMNPNYHRGEGYAFVDREPLPPSLACPVSHASNNGFVSDSGLLEFRFQQEIQEEEKDNVKVVPGRYLPADTSVFYYED